MMNFPKVVYARLYGKGKNQDIYLGKDVTRFLDTKTVARIGIYELKEVVDAKAEMKRVKK